MWLRGELTTSSLAEIFRTVLENGKAGTLLVRDGETTKSIHLGPHGVRWLAGRGGRVPPLETLLPPTGLVADADLAKALDRARSEGRKLEEILVGQGIVTAENIERTLRARLGDEVSDLFLLKGARFEFSEGPVPPVPPDPEDPISSISLDVNELLAGVKRGAEGGAVVSRTLPSLHGVPIFLSEEAREEEDRSASEGLRRIYRLIDGATTLAEIADVLGIPKLETCKALAGPLERGRLRLLRLEEMVDLAALRIDEGDLERARRLYRGAVEGTPDDPEVAAIAGYALQERGLDADAASFYALAAREMARRRLLDRALDFDARARRLAPDDPEIRFASLEVRAAAGRLDEAKALGRDLVAADPLRGRAICEIILRADPGDSEFQLLRATILGQTPVEKEAPVKPPSSPRLPPPETRVEPTARVERMSPPARPLVPRRTTTGRARVRRGRGLRWAVALIALAGAAFAAWHEHQEWKRLGDAHAEVRGLVDRQQFDQARRRLDDFLASSFSPLQQSRARRFLGEIEDRRRALEDLDRRRAEEKRQKLADKVRELWSAIEKERWVDVVRALERAGEVRALAMRSEDPETLKKADDIIRTLERSRVEARELKERSGAMEKEGRVREAALLILKLHQNHPGTEAARGASYPLEIDTRPGGVKVTDARTKAEIGVTSDVAPLRMRLDPGEGARLRFDKPGYRTVERYVDDLTTGNLSVELTAKCEAWSLSLGEAITGEPVLAEGLLLVPCANRLWAVRVGSSPAVAWSRTFRGEILGLPRAGKGRVYVSTGSMELHALVLGDVEEERRIAWTYAAGERLSGPPGLSGDGGLVLVGGASRALHLVDASTGEPRGRIALPGEVCGEPLTAGGVTVLACDDGSIQGRSGPGLRDLSWTWKAGGRPEPLHIGDGRVYVGGSNRGLSVLDAATGTPVWDRTLPAALSGRACRAEGIVFAAARDSRLYSLDSATGQRVGTFRMGGPAPGGAASAGTRALIGSEDQVLYAFDPSFRDPLWTFSARGRLRFAPAIGRNFAYLPVNESIYAIELN